MTGANQFDILRNSNSLTISLSSTMENIDRVHPGVRVMETSAKSGAGIEEWVDWVRVKA